METSMSRRGALTVIAGGLATVAAIPTEGARAAGASPRPDFAAVAAWEDATSAAAARGEAWVKDAKQLGFCVQLAVWQAEEAGAVALLPSLRAALAEAEALHAARSSTFQAWADAAWSLPELSPWPAEPWV